MSLSAKSITSGLLRRLMTSQRSGISRVGRLLIRAAEHIQFHGRRIEQDWFFGQRPEVAGLGWKTRSMGKVVYDFGANKGNNIPYYLHQGFNVVAVEANPLLATRIATLYKDNPEVHVVNACIVDTDERVRVPFFIHRHNDVLSTFIEPVANADDFIVTEVNAVSPLKLFKEFGAPFFVKIDVEGFDGPLAKSTLIAAPDLRYISAEVHSFLPLCHFVSHGFDRFKVVESPRVGCGFYDIPASGSKERYRFDFHDAGPFGEDIPGPWLSADEIFTYLCKYGTGWKDIHARRSDCAEEGA
jgi:FkbM family methyltransferase